MLEIVVELDPVRLGHEGDLRLRSFLTRFPSYPGQKSKA